MRLRALVRMNCATPRRAADGVCATRIVRRETGRGEELPAAGRQAAFAARRFHTDPVRSVGGRRSRGRREREREREGERERERARAPTALSSDPLQSWFAWKPVLGWVCSPPRCQQTARTLLHVLLTLLPGRKFVGGLYLLSMIL
ncbi:hypothetical protein GN956_G3674 [Arapaima gigas]